MNTTSADVRALICVNRKWKALPANEKMLLSQVYFVHPTAHLIKELKFVRNPSLNYATSLAWEEWWEKQDADYCIFEVPKAVPRFFQHPGFRTYSFTLYDDDCYVLDRCGFELGRVISPRSDEYDEYDNHKSVVLKGLGEDDTLSHED